MINFFNQSNYNYLLIGILGLLVGWLISKLLVNKHWEKRYKKLESENGSYLTLLDESDTHARSYDKVVKKLSSQLALLNSDNRTLVKAFTKQQTRRNILESQLDTSASLFKEAKQDNIELKDKNTSLIDKLDIAVKEQQNFKELEELTANLKASNTELQQKLTSSEGNHQETDAVLKNVKATHDELWQEYRLLQEDMSSQSTARAQSEAQEKKQLEQLNTKVGELSSERDQLIINAEKHIVDMTEIKTIREKANVLEKEERKLSAKILKQQQELETFTDLQIKLQSSENKNSTLKKNLDLEKHNSNVVLRQNEELQNTILETEKQLNESTYQESTAAQEEIKRYQDYLLKSETRWASKLNTLNLKLKSEQRSHIVLLQQASDETRSTDSKLIATIEKLEKTEAKLEKKAKQSTKNSSEVAPKTASKTTPQTKRATKTKPRFKYKLKSKQKRNNQIEVTKSSSKSSTAKKTDIVNSPSLKNRYPIDTIKGVGVVYAKRLKGIKVDHVDTLLSKGNTPAGRKSLSTRTDIDEKLILSWVGQADLLRVDGIDADNAELLEAAGINNTTELSNTNINSLTKKLIALNKKNKISSKTPSKDIVSDWTAHSIKLSKVVEFNAEPEMRSTVKSNKKNIPQTKATAKRSNKLNKADELTKIKGIGKVNEKLLHSLGIKTFAQIAKFTKQDEIEIGGKLSSFHNRISKENWIKQAAELLKKN